MLGRALPKSLRVLSYLPLSHVAAQMLDLVAPIVITASGDGYGPDFISDVYYTTWFAKPDALKGTLKASLVACKPSLFLGVPRVWEKIKETMQEIGRNNSKGKQAIAGWAKRHAFDAAKGRQLGGNGSTTVSYLLAKKVCPPPARARPPPAPFCRFFFGRLCRKPGASPPRAPVTHPTHSPARCRRPSNLTPSPSSHALAAIPLSLPLSLSLSPPLPPPPRPFSARSKPPWGSTSASSA